LDYTEDGSGSIHRILVACVPNYTALAVSSPLYILELSRLTRVEKAVKNTTINVILERTHGHNSGPL